MVVFFTGQALIGFRPTHNQSETMFFVVILWVFFTVFMAQYLQMSLCFIRPIKKRCFKVELELAQDPGVAEERRLPTDQRAAKGQR